MHWHQRMAVNYSQVGEQHKLTVSSVPHTTGTGQEGEEALSTHIETSVYPLQCDAQGQLPTWPQFFPFAPAANGGVASSGPAGMVPCAAPGRPPPLRPLHFTSLTCGGPKPLPKVWHAPHLAAGVWGRRGLRQSGPPCRQATYFLPPDTLTQFID